MVRQALISDLAPILAASSSSQIRKSMMEHIGILYPYLCPITWLHAYFDKQFITCACTNNEGYFQKTIWYPCAGDKPDLYFTARQYINGMGCVTLYEPTIACNTYWNYLCGSMVILETTEAAARVCVPGAQPPDPAPGEPPWVMPYGIGGTRVDQIKSTGLVDAHGKIDAPFAKSLGFRHGFSSSIPEKAVGKPYFYRWEYKKEGGSTGWQEFVTTIVRHYVFEQPSKLPVFPECKMGPFVVNEKNLYRFRPSDPTLCDDVVSHTPADNIYWPPDSWFAEIYTGILNTLAVLGGTISGHGRYKLKLTVYDHQGTLLAPTGVAAAFKFVVPTGSLSPTMVPREALPAEIEDDGYIFYVHIDNRKCTAIIDPPSISGSGPADLCGFLRYSNLTDNVNITFHAKQDDEHATCTFYIKRANSLLGPTYGAGEIDDAQLKVVGSSPAVMFYNNTLPADPGRFADTFTASDLLGPICAQAAFAEVLDVEAKATNGWRRIDEYDSSTVRAFALAPEEE